MRESSTQGDPAALPSPTTSTTSGGRRRAARRPPREFSRRAGTEAASTNTASSVGGSAGGSESPVGRVSGDLAPDMCQVRCIDARTVARVRGEMPGASAVALASQRLRVLGDPTRLRLLAALARADELCVCDLALLVGTTVSASAVSHALRLLRGDGLVTYRRSGKLAMYRLTDASVHRLIEDVFAVTTALSRTEDTAGADDVRREA